MKKIGESRPIVTDSVDVKRIPYLVEASDVGKAQPKYLGNQSYMFQEDDVGRLIEVVLGMSPGSMSWWFGSNHKDLREKYPDPKPYCKGE